MNIFQTNIQRIRLLLFEAYVGDWADKELIPNLRQQYEQSRQSVVVETLRDSYLSALRSAAADRRRSPLVTHTKDPGLDALEIEILKVLGGRSTHLGGVKNGKEKG